MVWTVKSGRLTEQLCIVQAMAMAACGLWILCFLWLTKYTTGKTDQHSRNPEKIIYFDIGKPYFESFDDEQADGWFSFQTLLNGRICSESRNLLSKPNPIKILYVHILQH